MRKAIFMPAFAQLVTAVVLLGAGCAGDPEPRPSEGQRASELYQEAERALQIKNYQKAARYLKQLRSQYPFGRYADQAQLELAYAYYKDGRPESAISAAQRFIRMNPTHEHVDYAYYLKGLVNFDRDSTLFSRLQPRGEVYRDQGHTRQAFQDFAELVRKFPDSRYAEDARQRMVYLRNKLAAHEMYVARFYLERGVNVAAANRAKYVLEHYPQTPSTAEALAILSQCYEKMGMSELAQDARVVLTENHPDHPLINGEDGESGLLAKLWPFD